MSHRSKPFETVLEDAEKGMRHHLGIPDNYSVLFLQGGASLQFSMVPINLSREDQSVDVIHTGIWTKKAIVELAKLRPYVEIASGEAKDFTAIPDVMDVPFNSDAAYVYVTSNNTIFGTQYHAFPDTGDVPLVADMSSDILSRALDMDQFGLIFAGAQKNIGPSGVTVVIVRKDLMERCLDSVPSMLQYRHQSNPSPIE
jgi:phosphoserine aminotransferase